MEVLRTSETTRASDAAEKPSQSAILAVFPGSSSILRSSGSLSWRGILLEKHHNSQGERRSVWIDRHVISMFPSSPCRFEYRCQSGGFASTVTYPRAIMITPAGPVPDLRFHTSAEMIHCALEEELIRSVNIELEHAGVEPRFRPGLQEKSIQRILEMLVDELEAGQPFGRLYVDSLAYALATRYLLLDVGTTRRTKSTPAALVPRLLSRVREKIEANLEADLSLESLASESGYSRAHFLRMFRRATGLTPHQYVLDVRLNRAQERLRQPGASIIDVAASCGFSSQSHMTSVFRQRLEMTPSQFRRRA